MINKKTFAELAEYLNDLGLSIPYHWPKGSGPAPQSITIRNQQRIEGSLFSWMIAISQLDMGKRLHTNGYHCTLLTVPEIRHMDTEEGSTALLEQELKCIDWNHVLPWMLREQEQIGPLLERLFGLADSMNPAFSSIGQQLILKYLLGTPLEPQVGYLQEKDQYEHFLFAELNGLKSDLPAKDALLQLQKEAQILWETSL
jgi:hypothetical protein